MRKKNLIANYHVRAKHTLYIILIIQKALILPKSFLFHRSRSKYSTIDGADNLNIA